MGGPNYLPNIYPTAVEEENGINRTKHSRAYDLLSQPYDQLRSWLGVHGVKKTSVTWLICLKEEKLCRKDSPVDSRIISTSTLPASIRLSLERVVC